MLPPCPPRDGQGKIGLVVQYLCWLRESGNTTWWQLTSACDVLDSAEWYKCFGDVLLLVPVLFFFSVLPSIAQLLILLFCSFEGFLEKSLLCNKRPF